MPASFVIDHQQRVVWSRGWGELVASDLEATQHGLREDKNFDPMYRQIYDFSEVTDVFMSRAQLQSLAYNSPFSPAARRAIVVKSDMAFGMARMYSLMSDRDPEHFRIFRDRESALKWLGVSDNSLPERAQAEEDRQDLEAR